MIGAAMTSGPRHPWELLLAQLEGLSALNGGVPLAHAWGSEDDAKCAPIDHITWIPGAPTFEPRTLNLLSQEVTDVLALPHSVVIYGDSPLVCLQRALDMRGALDLVAGPPKGSIDTNPPRPGYAMKGPSKPVVGGELAGGSWRLELGVTLKLFCVRQVYGSALVKSVPISVQALLTPTDAPSGDPLNPIGASA